MTDPNGGVTKYAYDRFDRVQYVYLPDRSSGSAVSTANATYTYDNLGDTLSVASRVTSSVTGTTSYVWNVLGQQVEVDQPAVSVNGSSGTTTPITTYGYDPLGDRVSVTDPNGNYASTHYSTKYTFNSFGSGKSPSLVGRRSVCRWGCGMGQHGCLWEWRCGSLSLATKDEDLEQVRRRSHNE